MKIAILTSGTLPIPAVLGGAVENLVDFYLDYNNIHELHDITVYSIYHPNVKSHPALKSKVNHYVYIDTHSLWARIKRRLYVRSHPKEYHNYFIEYYFEECYKRLRNNVFDAILLENRPGYAYKLSERGIKNIQLHLHNNLLNSTTPHAQVILQSLTKVLTVSNYIKHQVDTIERTNKVHTIYNGIDLNLFSNKTSRNTYRKKLGIREEDFVLVFSGRINKDKGISELIDALLLLNKPQIKLLVLGSPFFGNFIGENSFIRKLKEKAAPIKDRIIFTGFIPYQEVPIYLGLADVAVIPSIWEDPFPTTVLEAQAMGLPVIVTDRGGIPEEIGQSNAVTVPLGNSFEERLSQAILDLYSNPSKRGDMGQASLSHSRFFNKERFAYDMLNAISG